MANIFKQKIKLGNLFKFALPSILMQLTLALYTIVDGIFVSRFVGTTALSAVNIVTPVFSILLAMSIMFSTGGGAIVGKELGEKRAKTARNTFTFVIISSLAIVSVIAVFGLVFLKQLVTALGATENILPYGIDYIRIILLFAPSLVLMAMFQVFFITEGKPRLGLITTIGAGITNIVLDYVFIVMLDMGVKGAALATGIGYTIPAVIGLVYFMTSKKNLYFVKPKFNFTKLLNAVSNGSSEMVTNLSSAIVTFLINILFLKYYGESGVAAITIILYFEFIFLAIYQGFSIGVAPVISYKYGDGNAKDLKRLYRHSLTIVLSMACALLIFAIFSMSTILSIFTTDEAVITIAKEGFPYFAASLGLMSINVFASAFFTALSDGFVSATISFLRSFIFLVGSLLLLPNFFGELGLWMGNTVAEILAIIISMVFLIGKRKKYNY